MLLLFVIGLELQPCRLWVMRHQVFGLGSAQVLSLSVVLGALLNLLGLPLGTVAIIGFALALSSTAFVLQSMCFEITTPEPRIDRQRSSRTSKHFVRQLARPRKSCGVCSPRIEIYLIRRLAVNIQ